MQRTPLTKGRAVAATRGLDIDRDQLFAARTRRLLYRAEPLLQTLNKLIRIEPLEHPRERICRQNPTR